MKLSLEPHAVLTAETMTPPSGTRCRRPTFLAEQIHQIIDRVVLETGVKPSAMYGRDRTKLVSRARRHVWLLMAEHGMSTTEIGALFGRDHSTVVSGLKKARMDSRLIRIRVAA